MKQLSITEEKIYKLLKRKKGKVVEYKDLFLTQSNPVKVVMLGEFLKNEDLKKKYFDVLKNQIRSIEKKLEIEIKSQNKVGYFIKK
jgi:hypothetical protein